MSEDDRREWLLAAWGTLQGIPADLLARGCQTARETCDHPSKLVPAILAEVKQAWAWRRENNAGSSVQSTYVPAESDFRPCSPEEAKEIMGQFRIPPLDAKPVPRGPLRKPTRQDYLDMGVDPAVLNSIETESRAE